MTQFEEKRVFHSSESISSREVVYSNPKQALTSPLAHKLFGFPWAEEITVSQKSITVAKQDWVDWSVLEEPLIGLIQEHLNEAKEQGAIEENPELKVTEVPKSFDEGTDTEKQIRNIITSQINPSLASHGGFVELVGVQEKKAFIKMGGGCQGCEQSRNTLKNGIESSILAAVPGLAEVVDITDHASGETPYY